MQTAIAVPIEHVLVLAAALFLIGLTGVLVRRNVSFILMSLESTASRCEQLARQILVFDRPLPPDEVSARIDAVDRDAIDAAARRLFTRTPTFAALGPVQRVQSFEEIVERLV